MSVTHSDAFPRRSFLKAGGTFVVSTTLASPSLAQGPGGASAPVGQPDPNALDSWVKIHPDNTATIFIGHTELGQGISTSLLQIAAEELDLDMAQVKSIPLETGKVPNQGATVASSGISRGGPRIRQVAAEVKQALLGMASTQLGVPIGRLTVRSGVVSVTGTPAQTVSYVQLVGDGHFNLAMTGRAPIKSYRDHTVVGTSVPRVEVPAKARGTYPFMQNVRLPGMLHGRVVRPRGQGSLQHGATVVSVDAESIRDIPGVRVVRIANFVGVVARDEWHAVQAAQRLRVTWDMPPLLPPTPDALYDRLRTAVTADRILVDRGDVPGALKQAAFVASGRYEAPYQAHGPFAPNCAIADVKADSALIINSAQGIYNYAQNTVAGMLNLPREKVTARYVESSGTYGPTCYNDVSQAAALLSREVGAPVRVQFMRHDEHGWEPYQPAHVGEVTIACDAAGKLLVFDYQGWNHTNTSGETTAQLATGAPVSEGDSLRLGPNPFNSGDMYVIPNWRIVRHVVPGLNGYLKASPLRSPFDIHTSFAGEQVMDDLAYRANHDPYQFRRQNINGERWLAVLEAVAQASNWMPRRAASQLGTGRVRKGRGIGVGTHLSSYAAAVAEIDVDTQTGVIVARHMYGAVDAGQAINPRIIERQIGGQLCQAASRMLKEEVTFNSTNVTSLDWGSYPVLRFGEAPKVTAIVVKRQDQPSTGAGAEALAGGASAIANAFFDATGVRMHRFPLTPARVLAALKQA